MGLYGIDISHWNGDIDFTKLNKTFVIMKVSQFQHKDAKFDEYYSKCKLPKGAYIYNRVKNLAEAKIEADFAVKALDGRKLEYGVWLDMEDASMRILSRKTLTDIINCEAEILIKAGYRVGIYCNRDWYMNVLDSEMLSEIYPFWIARYPSDDTGIVKPNLSPDKLKGCKIWQYSSKGKVDGIKGNVDLSIEFDGPFNGVNQKVNELPKPVLKLSSRGENVKAVQTYLSLLGYQVGAIDGIYGKNTEAAVRQYQIDLKLKVDGIWGPECWGSVK